MRKTGNVIVMILAFLLGVSLYMVFGYQKSSNYNPIWSSDGKYIVFSCQKFSFFETLKNSQGQTSIVDNIYDPNRNELCVFNNTNATLETITKSDFSEWSPKWIPNTLKLAYISNEGGNDNLYVLDVINKSLKKIEGSEYVVRHSWSSDGNRVALITSYVSGKPDKMQMSIVDGNIKTILVNSSETMFSLSWSPDMQSIAYITGEWPNECKIKLMDVRNNDAVTLPNPSACGGDPVWSKEGSYLAYRGAPDEEIVIYDVPEDKSTILQYPTKSAVVSEWAWGPDNRNLVALGYGNLLRYSMDNHEWMNLIDFDNALIGDFSISSDGKQIAFTKIENGIFNTSIWILNSNGSELKELEP